MNYEKLADWVVSQGVAESDTDKVFGRNNRIYWIDGDVHSLFCAEALCHDWRVCGAMMEKLPALKLLKIIHDWYFDTTELRITPPAILTAIYEAMNDDDAVKFAVKLEMNCD